MHITDDKILLCVQNLLSLMCFLTPEQVDNIVTSLVDLLECFLRERFPTFFLMAIAFTLANCQNCVEEEYSLTGPSCEITMHGNWWLEINLGIILQS